jgi:N-succinyldiaminopimelate aminotransferase
MNPNINNLQPYPFEKLRKLTSNIKTSDQLPIAWSIGEPKHEPPEFLNEVLMANISGYSKYPATSGLPELKEAISRWIQKRFLSKHPAHIDASKNVLPVTGTREALFSVVQALYDPTKTAKQVWMPNPFYQIYEGATLLAGGEVHFLNCTAEHNYQPNFRSIADEQWRNCQILFICTPGNPSGTTISIDDLKFLAKKAKQFNFILISDECYSELYRDELNPPAGLLEACDELADCEFTNCLAFHSLSKRSNLPGLRSGFVAGDKTLIQQFLKYRTYHGCAMPFPHQMVSIAAWNDEEHVLKNRQLYNAKFQMVHDELHNVLPVNIPSASFYLWPNLESDDEATAVKWLTEANIRVLPGQYLSRKNNGVNPGYGHIRIALVATLDECFDATQRLKKIL